MNKIPVFYHIPKCGGTYVITKSRELLRFYNKGIGVLLLTNQEKSKTLARIFLKNTKIYSTPLSDGLIAEILPRILFITIEPDGIILKDILLDSIQSNILHEFTIFRNPFDRLQSFYNYIRSEESKHEPTHMAIKYQTFAEYIESNNFEPDWIVRNFSNNINQIINHSNYRKAVISLSRIKVYDIKNIEDSIEECFKNCYPDLNLNNFNYAQTFKNSCQMSKLKFTDLTEDKQRLFLEKTMWERLLYSTYCND